MTASPSISTDYQSSLRGLPPTRKSSSKTHQNAPKMGPLTNNFLRPLVLVCAFWFSLALKLWHMWRAAPPTHTHPLVLPQGTRVVAANPNITTTSSAHYQPIIKISCQNLINNQISDCKPINKHWLSIIIKGATINKNPY